MPLTSGRKGLRSFISFFFNEGRRNLCAVVNNCKTLRMGAIKDEYLRIQGFPKTKNSSVAWVTNRRFYGQVVANALLARPARRAVSKKIDSP